MKRPIRRIIIETFAFILKCRATTKDDEQTLENAQVPTLEPILERKRVSG